MAMTPKQDRNGVPGPMTTSPHTAQPGPDATKKIQSLMRQAENYGNARKNEAHSELLNTPQGSGVNGHEIGGGGNMYEWDSNLAVSEVPGEA
jgi:hypothetical protein